MGINLLAAEQLQLVNISLDTIVFTLINTLIIFLLYRFLLHNKVMAILEQRKEKTCAEIEIALAKDTDNDADRRKHCGKHKDSNVTQSLFSF